MLEKPSIATSVRRRRTCRRTDRISEALIAGGGDQGPCGWLKDPYGLSWQVVPTVLMQLMGDPDSEKSGQVRDAMMLMTRLDTVGLQRANGGG